MKNKLILVSISVLLFCACEQARVRNWGGSMNIDIAHDQKLVNITWKEDGIWYLTKPMRADDIAENYIFRQKKSFGSEGTVTLKEFKK